MEFDLENPVLDTDSLFVIELDHVPSSQYVKSLKLGGSDFTVRQETISSISQLCAGADPELSYLAVNYLDRFLSSQSLPKPKPWVYRLVAVSCVSLAAKMQKTEFSLPCFQGDGGLVYDAQTVQRMEMLILGALKWRMRSVTPFSFLPLFISSFKLDDQPSRLALKARAREIIVKSQNDIKLLEFKPSVIAAAALLSASHDLFPFQFLSFQRSICGCSYVNKDEILCCSNMIQIEAMEGYESTVDEVSSSETPINVLDLHLSSSSDTGDSQKRLPKRRRMDELILNNQTVRIHN